jgi:hypothetical protein
MLADDAGVDCKDAGQRRRPDIHFSYCGEGMLMLFRMFACGAVLTAALILSAPLAYAGGHGGGGHGGGGHGGGGHGGGGFHSSGFHSSSFHGSSFHGSSFHGSSFHSSGFHSASAWHGGSTWHNGSWHNGSWHGNNFHNGFHSAHFHNGNRVFVSIGLGGWGWGWGGWGWGWGGWGWGGWGWGWPWWWNSGSWGDSSSFVTYAPTYTTTPVIYRVISGPGSTMPYDDGANNYTPSSDGTYQYDGGPRVPVPMPHPDTAPKGDKSVEPDGTNVARIAARPKYMYPAYGEGAMDVAKAKTPASTDKQTAKKSGGN